MTSSQKQRLKAADDAYKAHFPTFQAAHEAYGRMEIGDDEYLVVRQEHDRLIAAFDAVFSAIESELQGATQ